MKQETAEKAAQATVQVRDKAALIAQKLKERTPDPVLEKTAQAAAQVRESAAKAGQYAADKAPEPLRETAGQAATAARTHRTPLLAAGALLAVVMLVRRGRGHRR
ncbi:hypothetical protein OHS17_30075 [Streptomyces sp. NBC_00523]|uniref:hypothetical protein n=1 Tax=unclassified Streptomyces TaxID=2593676 RepID=UPI002E80381B|nr:hypothetical protein [Streptomyces sp. NBC_00523]WUD03631.1 hypothetical protein OHS17_30075 [Streptomyces sp. NBC_00523]